MFQTISGRFFGLPTNFASFSDKISRILGKIEKFSAQNPMYYVTFTIDFRLFSGTFTRYEIHLHEKRISGILQETHT